MHDYEVAGTSRKALIYHKEKLYQLGGVRQDAILKWAHK